MALAYLIKRTGSWHVGLRAISHIQLDQFSIADVAVWTPYQRVFSSAPLTSPLTADDTIPPEPTQPKKEKSKNRYDLDAVHATAERVFDSRLEIETTTAESAAQTAGISDTLLHDYEEIVNEMDKKREKHPIKEFETLERWTERHEEALQPFYRFLHRHGLDSYRTVASLYSAGARGRRVMVKKEAITNTTSATATIEVVAKEKPEIEIPIFEVVFSRWQAALKREPSIEFRAEQLLLRWPLMLSRQPTEVGATLAVLSGALPRGTNITQMLYDVPQLIGIPPMALQHRLVSLQIATEGGLQQLLVACPRLMTFDLSSIFSNLRLIREYSRSSREFRSFLYVNPDALVRPKHFLAGAATAVLYRLRSVLQPLGIDAVQVVKAKPHLLLVRASWLPQRWDVLYEMTQSVPHWQEEMEGLIKDAAAGSTLLNSSSNSSGSSSDSAARASGSTVDKFNSEKRSSVQPPAWVEDADLDPHSLGLNRENPKERNKNSLSSSEVTDTDSATFEKEGNNDDVGDADILHKAHVAFSALGEALYMRPWRIERLQYLAAEAPEEAANVSFVSVMAVNLDTFQQRFPGFDDWKNKNIGTGGG